MGKEHYFGGKSGDGHYQQIINLIPPHKIYIEPFGGKVGIFRHKRPAYATFIFERDEKLIPYYEKIGIRQCYELYDLGNRIYKGAMGAFFYIGDAFELLADYTRDLDKENVFIYADPPYPMSSRKDPRSTYRYELTDDEHRELLYTLLRYQNAKIALSTYKNDIYDNHFEDREYNMCEVAAQTRHGRVTEQLWMNYPAPNELHDYQYLGADYREREDIQRKQKRWLRKFSEMTILEQRAMMEKLTSGIGSCAERGQGKKIDLVSL